MTSNTNTNTAEIYNKTSKILSAIENCSCEHCLKILKSGLGRPTPEPDAGDHSETNLNVQT